MFQRLMLESMSAMHSGQCSALAMSALFQEWNGPAIGSFQSEPFCIVLRPVIPILAVLRLRRSELHVLAVVGGFLALEDTANVPASEAIY